MSDKMKIEFPAKSAYESFARVTVAAFISRLDPTIVEINEVKTAVSEAVTNSIIHGYDNASGTIYIECEIIGQTVTIIIADKGKGIADINRARTPLFTTNPDGERSGMGFTVMETFMDCVEVKSFPGVGTKLTMKKEIATIKEEGAKCG